MSKKGFHIAKMLMKNANLSIGDFVKGRITRVSDTGPQAESHFVQTTQVRLGLVKAT